MMRARIYRGAGQIGGSRVVVEFDGQRLVLDLGLSLDAGWRDEASALAECEPWPDPSRSAAAFVHMAFAGFPPLTKCPAWVRATLKEAEMEGLGAGMRAARKAARNPRDGSWLQWG